MNFRPTHYELAVAQDVLEVVAVQKTRANRNSDVMRRRFSGVVAVQKAACLPDMNKGHSPALPAVIGLVSPGFGAKNGPKPIREKVVYKPVATSTALPGGFYPSI